LGFCYLKDPEGSADTVRPSHRSLPTSHGVAAVAVRAHALMYPSWNPPCNYTPSDTSSFLRPCLPRYLSTTLHPRASRRSTWASRITSTATTRTRRSNHAMVMMVIVKEGHY
jgi:hypothetical protein